METRTRLALKTISKQDMEIGRNQLKEARDLNG